MFENNESKYADIIDLPRPKSKHKPMSMHDRAAQFSSFSALTGLDDELSEAARKRELPMPDLFVANRDTISKMVSADAV